MRTKRSILQKVDEWKNVPLMVSGVYRLFTYLPWEEIPEEYREFFPEEASEEWDKDLDEFGKKEMKMDIGAEIHALLRVLSRKNVTNCLGLIPMVLADVYMYGSATGPLQGRLAKITEQFKQNVDLDRPLAEQYAIFEIIDLLKDIVDRTNIELNYDIDVVLGQLMEKYKRDLDQSIKAMAEADKQVHPPDNEDGLDYEKIVAEAEAKEKEAKEKEAKEEEEKEDE